MTGGQVTWTVWCLLWVACYCLAAASKAATDPVQAALLVLAAGASMLAILIPARRWGR